jgi:hypothetical protein
VPRDPLDRDYTPDDVARRLVDALTCEPYTVLEPSVGGGAFARACRARWADAIIGGCDLDPAAPGLTECDAFAVGDYRTTRLGPVDLVVGNPPYAQAEAHVRAALADAPGGTVAFLLRLGFLAGQARGEGLWRDHPPDRVHVLSRRPSFRGGKTDATEYGWFVWRPGARGVRMPPTVRWV